MTTPTNNRNGPTAAPAPTPVTALKGIFGTGTATKPISVEQMNAAIAASGAAAQKTVK